ncbi:putative bifunctional diguanylate cyclase/phosphodiesterase [Halomonas jincaotanensis]|uniref:putative bifunctional diguanylate cyclase/phosphodiesterase n=1 Tax=Halomonas jincaotanensis TaxID=2810616 RepID=UPI002022FB16|nr:EAL domain-containing protein [Halomonas jincaotanensis]
MDMGAGVEQRWVRQRAIGAYCLVVMLLAAVLAVWSQRVWVLGGMALMIAVLGGLLLRYYLNHRQLEEDLRQRVRELEQARRTLQQQYKATLDGIAERKVAEDEIRRLAFFDPLTGLPNRRLLLDRLEVALKDSCRSGQLGALLIIDLDNFKQINDTRGHFRGDQLLRQIADTFDAVLRDTDSLARLGGDEFAVLLQGIGPDEESVAHVSHLVAYKLLGVLETAFPLGDEALRVTGSIGITLFRDRGITIDEVLQQADMAQYQAKVAGRNTLRFFDPTLHARLQARARLETDLRQALPRDEFRLHYQVQVNAAGETVGAEALLRWQHPERGMVLPGVFIPLAEENRLILPIGDWVLETACAQLVAWAGDPSTSALTISVNVSPRQFREADFVERVMMVLERTGAPADHLKLEITESLLLEARDNAREKMLRLKERGVIFSLDDFGTGYSSLSYLKRLPLTQLKIDQAFVHDLLEDDTSAAIVASTITLSNSLQLEVIAEGVEGAAQRDWLVEHGCLAFQGNFFGRPVAAEELSIRATSGPPLS